jgi:hypothetical protein
MRTNVNVSPYEAYCLFLALKTHFTTPNYDFFKYGGKLNTKKNSFDTRKDKYFFERLAKHKDLKSFLVANFIEQDVKWVGDLLSSNSENTYIQWQKRTQSLNYIIKTEIQTLDGEFKTYFKVENGQHPKLLRMVLQKKISIETLTALDDLLNFFPVWDRKIEDTVIWPSVRNRSLKYRQFISYDKEALKSLCKQLSGIDTKSNDI